MTDLLILSLAVSAIYALLLAGYARLFFNEGTRLGNALKAGLPAALLLHIAWLVYLGLHLRHLPITSPFESLTTLALLVSLVYSYIELRSRIRSTGALIFVFVLVLQIFSTAILAMNPAAPHVLGSPLLNVHISLALLGYTAFCISFLYSIMYLMLHEDIKKAHFGLFYEKMPSLEQLDDMNFSAATVGASVLVVSILVGFVWAWTAFGKLPFTDIKVLVTLLLAVIYGVITLMKSRFGWGGERIAFLSVVGFVFVLASLLVVNVFSESFHSFF